MDMPLHKMWTDIGYADGLRGINNPPNSGEYQEDYARGQEMAKLDGGCDMDAEEPDDLGYGNPDKFICTDPGCHGECGTPAHQEGPLT